MATVTFKGSPIHTCGNLPEVGSQAPDFLLVDGDLNEKTLKDFAGKKIVLNIVPSLDTGICAATARKFNEVAGSLDNTTVLMVSADLPFAQGRFCSTEGIDGVIPLSSFRNPAFGEAYGMTLIDSPLKGLLGRALLIIDPSGKITYTELVPEIAQEPDYERALENLA